MRAAGAPAWIARVCSGCPPPNAVAGLSGLSAGAGRPELERAAADEADAALAALAATTNLCAGNDAEADAFRVSNPELAETIRCVAEEESNAAGVPRAPFGERRMLLERRWTARRRGRSRG